MILTMYNQYQDDQSYPTWLVITIDKDLWETEIIYFSVHQDIVQKDMDEIPEDVPSFSVYLEDLVRSSEIFGKVGINVTQVKNRVSGQPPRFPDSTQLLIRVIDLEEVLSFSNIR
ncbi:hypothetical protein [Brevibacillus nitrificans]|uniref:hypothetical protein n=1 Tax=Brevibacillus nitrificans TaxID=651560 RepID=UPI00261B9DB3|nr:hypothetical protein [Brevibacillus nitrificans]